MDPNEPILTRSELNTLLLKYREMKHTLNNTLAVLLARAELGLRNPAQLDLLAKAVMSRCEETVKMLTVFGDELGAKLKDGGPASSAPLSGAFPPQD